MKTPSFFGKIIQQIEERGMGRQELAKRLKVSSSMISHMKSGVVLPADDKLEIIADLAQTYTPHELMLAKMVTWIESKGITPAEIAAFAEKSKIN